MRTNINLKELQEAQLIEQWLYINDERTLHYFNGFSIFEIKIDSKTNELFGKNLLLNEDEFSILQNWNNINFWLVLREQLSLTFIKELKMSLLDYIMFSVKTGNVLLDEDTRIIKSQLNLKSIQSYKIKTDYINHFVKDLNEYCNYIDQSLKDKLKDLATNADYIYFLVDDTSNDYIIKDYNYNEYSIKLSKYKPSNIKSIAEYVPFIKYIMNDNFNETMIKHNIKYKLV